MKKAIVLNSKDIKEILAKYFNVPENKVVKSQYSYTVIIESEDKKE